jgi:hypothetical protein
MRQYVLWISRPSAARPGKTDKITINPFTGKAHDAHDPSIWMSYTDAQALLATGIGTGIGIVLTDNDPLFCVDIDNALQSDGRWSPLANELCRYFAGCFIEVSHSGRGLHIIGSTTTPVEHRTRDVHNAGLELYTRLRFIAFGSQGTGSMSHIADTQLNWLIATYFPPATSVKPADWTDGPCPEWNGPTDDDELIAKMLSATGSAFSKGASPTDLWAGICDEEGRSEADAGLVSHLAFWTGRDCTRIDRLFRRSGLMRDKWDRNAGQGRTYGELTIAKYGTQSTSVYGDVKATPVMPVATAPASAPEGVYRGGGQILSLQNQIEYFRGCVYVRSAHKIFMPDGDMLDVGQFKAYKGGYEFLIEEGNSKGTKDAWEAFTQSRSYSFPQSLDTCFRPECPPGSIIIEEGRSMVNTYIPVITEIRKGDPSRFTDHIARMLPDPNDRAIMLAYMAAVVQHPGVKFQWCPLLIGMEGNGKSLIIRALMQAIGSRYTHLPNAQDISNKFNAWLQGKLLIGLEEVYTTDRADLIETLKPMITNEKIEIQGKGLNQNTGDNRANFVACSNHKDAIRKTGTDRRYAIFYTAQQEAGDLQRDGMGGMYFPRLYEWLRAEGYAIINGYLRTYQIPDELNPAVGCHRAPRTSSTEEAMTASLGVIEQSIVEMIAEGAPGFAGGFVSSKAMSRLFTELKRSVGRNKYHEIMRNIGYIPHPALTDGRVNNPLPGDDGKARIYVRVDSLQAQLTRPPDVVQRYIEAQAGSGMVGGVFRQQNNH